MLGDKETYLDDAEGLVDGGLGVEGEAGVNLGGNLAGDDLEDLLAELDEEGVEGSIDLLVDGATLLLGEGDGLVNQLGVLGLLGGGEDEGGVGGGILGLVLGDGCRLGMRSAFVYAIAFVVLREEKNSSSGQERVRPRLRGMEG